MAEQKKDVKQRKVSKGGFWRWTKRLIAGLITLVLLLVLTGIIYQTVASARDLRRYPPPGRLVDVGGHRLHINCTGDGTPTVVLDAGVCDCSLNWCLVQPEVARFTTVCSYDRAGMGWSDAGPSPRTSMRIVRELHALLENAGIPGPYVLVGHSFGGYNVRLFAHEYPEQVAGLVLVDAAHEDQWPRLPESVNGLYDWWTQWMKSVMFWNPLGVSRLFNYVGTNPSLPANLQATDRALRTRTQYMKTLYDEWIAVDKESAAQVRAGASLPQVPMIVLTAEKHGEEPPPGVTEEDFAKWNELLYEVQADLASRCSGSVHIKVANSTHTIQLDQPAAVVDAIREVVMAAREKRPVRWKSEESSELGKSIPNDSPTESDMKVTNVESTESRVLVDNNRRNRLIGTWVKDHLESVENYYPDDSNWHLCVTFTEDDCFIWDSKKSGSGEITTDESLAGKYSIERGLLINYIFDKPSSGAERRIPEWFAYWPNKSLGQQTFKFRDDFLILGHDGAKIWFYMKRKDNIQ